MDHTLATPTDVPMAVSQPDQYESSSTSTYTIHKIEQEIERHAQIIIDLKVKRNRHLPIFKLPVELLCRIFRCVQDVWMDPYQFSYAGFPSRELAWIAVTRVCQHWRNAALNEPSLWTRPPLHYAKWTTVMLERSRVAGVTISFDSERSSVQTELLAAVVSHIPHTISLTVQHAQRGVVKRLLMGLRSSVAPMLKTLVIDGAYTPPYHVAVMLDSSDHDRTPTRLPEDAFLDSTKLRRLSLKSVDIEWKSHLLSSLTDLTLEKISPGARPSRTEFLSMLERNPGLRELTLRDALPTSLRLAGSSSGNHPRIQLVSLEVLNITAEVAECEFFFNNVIISNKIMSIDQHLKIKSNHNEERQLHRLITALDGATSSHRLGSRSRCTRIDGGLCRGNLFGMPVLNFSTSGRAIGYTHEIPDYCESNDSALDLQLHLEYPSSITSPASAGADSRRTDGAIFSELFDGFHWDNLAQLDIRNLRVYYTGFSTTLAETFGRLPQLYTVFVGNSCANHLIDALFINSDKDPGLFSDSVTFSGLRHIRFDEVSFNREYDESLQMDRLLDCLMNRCERGVEIFSVSVETCSFFGDEQVRLLEEIVVDVDWDGDEHGYTEDEDEEDEDRDFYDESEYEDEVYFWDDY